LGVCKRNSGYLPIPLKYYAAHTGRWGGSDLINLQNLPTRDANKKSLKNSIIAPPGHTIVNADLSHIEARVLAWLAGQDDVVQAFAEGRDIYCEDATKAYGRVITKADKKERFVGKVMRLSLGFGTSYAKLQNTLRLQGDVFLPMHECMGLVNTWRGNNMNIVKLWATGEKTLKQLAYWPESGDTFYFDKHNLLPVIPAGIALPNGMLIKYPNLRKAANRFVYDSRKGPTNIWSGAVVENLVQALARIIVGEYLVVLAETHQISLTVHDSLVLLVKTVDLEETVGHVQRVMSTPPTWAPGLPVAVEIKHGQSYGDC
jgi:DNA polymerase